ncbi:MAG TPA: DNA mismatch repair endonuclease MutL [Candidatus Edwardsbacteria bacterium]|nr:DNA mismatch repair endonuclease MutL [Candidatus Edwardsbacteria bacterium]
MPIKVLPNDIVNKIAAGEVIERPSSVVKELLENSLDAGARAVEVEIRNGGLSYVRVSDDGGGMARSEMELALQRHATSKIASYEDIFTIASYGFRGEALPSIAAVSRLTMTSRPAGADAAFRLVCDAGAVAERAEAAAGQGTTITVEQLFANVPARRKFLKSELTETRRIVDEITAQALANPGTGFRLVCDGRDTLRYAPADRAQRAADVLGRELFATLRPFDHGQRPVRAFGFASRPEQLWPKRREQLIFVNGRRVSDKLVHAAVYQGYGPALLGRHPAYLVFLEVSPHEVDVNVHPAKSQVRFKDESLVFNTVKGAISRAMFAEDAGTSGQGRAPGTGFSYAPQVPLSQQTEAALQSVRELFAQPYQPLARAAAAEPDQQLVIYWQAHDRYIMAETKTGLIIIDQHAAHERVLYEQLLSSQEQRQAQQLLFPVSIELTAAESKVYEEYQSVFTALGFDIQKFSGRTIVVEGLPAAAGANVDGAAIIRGILSDLAEAGATAEEPANALARSFACHAAVKAGQHLDQAEMNQLVDRLFATSSPYLDPHGRPAVIKFTLDDLDRRFGRV